MKELVDNVYEIAKRWGETHFYGSPQIVLICSPEFYYKDIRPKMFSDNIHYIKTDPEYNIDFFNIIGIKVPIIISKDLNKNTVYKLMLRDDYEREEKEKIYQKFMKMWEERL